MFPNGAQGFDRPPGAIGLGNKTTSSNLPYGFNGLLTGVFSNSIIDDIQHRNPNACSSSSSSSVFAGNDVADRDDDKLFALNHATEIHQFLLRSGAAANESMQIAAEIPQPVATAEWLNFQLAASASAHTMPQQMAADSGCYGVRIPKYESSGLDDGRSFACYNAEEKVLLPSVAANSSLRSDFQAAPAAPAVPEAPAAPVEEKRRWFSEKTIDKKTKRMIKNRESAARSRARKQAYTLRLEDEVLRLKKMNEFLQRRKEFETKTFSSPVPQKYQLRRNCSAPH